MQAYDITAVIRKGMQSVHSQQTPLNIYFWLHWVVAAWLFPSFRKRGLLSSGGVRASHWGGFSLEHRL